MRISGTCTEPSLVNLWQTKYFKVENWYPKSTKQTEVKSNDVIHPHNNNLNQYTS